jgi:hypothetical protein
MSKNDIKFKIITFIWYKDNQQGYCMLFNRSYNDGLAIAKTYGFNVFKLYNPKTWKNKVIREEYNDRLRKT